MSKTPEYLMPLDIRRSFDNEDEAWKLLYLIDSEFQSDPMSVQCFDLSIVERVRLCIKNRERDDTRPPPPWKDATAPRKRSNRDE